jgi:hypothetical protein
MLRSIVKVFTLFAFGGLLYAAIELVARKWTRWTMVILGDICFVTLGSFKNLFHRPIPLLLQMFIGSGIITVFEFITGLIVNHRFGWNVWDYSKEPFNIKGQVCLRLSFYWFCLSASAIVVYDLLIWKMWKETPPIYTFVFADRLVERLKKKREIQ